METEYKKYIDIIQSKLADVFNELETVEDKILKAKKFHLCTCHLVFIPKDVY